MIVMLPIAFVIAEQEGTVTAIVWVLGSVLATAAICVAAHILRRMVFSKSDKHSPGFTIEQIDRLHNEGVLTKEEYRLARRSALGLTDLDASEQ